MAGDWIKVRTSLLSNPKINGIARTLGFDTGKNEVISNFVGPGENNIPRYVLRYVSVTAVITVWSAANEHTRNGVFENADLEDISDIAGIPGFGESMESVGWVIYDEEKMTVTLPNFNEYNTCGENRNKEKAAERQKDTVKERRKNLQRVTI